MTEQLPDKSPYLSDRPVGVDSDLLWEGTAVREEIDTVARFLARPLGESALYDSLTIAVYGKWGMGKSTALRMIKEEAERLATERGQSRNLLFCHYEAPIYEYLPQDPSVTLIARILTSFRKGSDDDILAQLGWRLGVESGSSQSADGGLVPAVKGLEDAAESIGKLIDPDVVLGSLLGAGPEPAEAGERKVLVVMLDDLDRVARNFVHKILKVVQQLSRVKNVFFILAIDKDHLQASVSVQEEDAQVAPKPAFALEKYVQYAIALPGLTDERFPEFLKRLLERAEYPPPIIEGLLDNSDLFLLALHERTPRSVKRCLNFTRSDLERTIVAAGPGRDRDLPVKRKLMEYFWPTLYERLLLPALAVRGESPTLPTCA